MNVPRNIQGTINDQDYICRIHRSSRQTVVTTLFQDCHVFSENLQKHENITVGVL